MLDSKCQKTATEELKYELQAFKKDIIREIKEIKLLTKKNSDTTEFYLEWIPRKKFIEICDISSSTYNNWKNLNYLEIKMIGTKSFVHKNCINRYFNGEFTIPK